MFETIQLGFRKTILNALAGALKLRNHHPPLPDPELNNPFGHKTIAWRSPSSSMPPSASVDVVPFVVIVAEDEALLRMIAIEFLTEEGFVVLEAEHAAEAISLLESQADDVHVLFTDHHMPGAMNGTQLVHHAHRHWPWVSLILTSGNIGPRSLKLPPRCRFVPKPYSPHHILHHVWDLVAAK